MKNAILRALAIKASEAPAKAVAAPATAVKPAPAIRKWSDRDFPIPATRGKAKAEAVHSIHFKILSRTK